MAFYHSSTTVQLPTKIKLHWGS